jgi:hypothetical protein
MHGEFPIGHPIYPFIISILFALSHPKPYQVTFQILTYLDLTLMRQDKLGSHESSIGVYNMLG